MPNFVHRPSLLICLIMRTPSFNILQHMYPITKLTVISNLFIFLYTLYIYIYIYIMTQQRSGLLLSSACNFSLFQCRTERFKKSYFPATTCLWNSLDYEFWDTQSLSNFKHCLQDFFDISTYEKRYDYALGGYSSILHSRLRLNCCALNYHLFKITCVTSPACDCGFNCESVIHYFLHCPRYAALRTSLLAAMVEILGNGWYYKSDSFKTKMFLFGSEKLTVDQNKAIFFHVQ